MNTEIASELVYAMSAYAGLCAFGKGVRRFGLEAMAAGLVGFLVTIVHGLVGLPECPFETANAYVAWSVLAFFFIRYVFHASPTGAGLGSVADGDKGDTDTDDDGART